MKAVLLWLTASLGAPILVLCTPTSLRLQRFHLLCCSQVTEARAPPDSQRAHSGAWVSVTVLPPPSTIKESKSKEDDPKSGCQAQRDSPLLVGKVRLQWPCFRLQAGPFPWPLHCFAAITASLNSSTLSGFSLTFSMATPPLARNMFWVDLVCLLWQKGSESARRPLSRLKTRARRPRRVPCLLDFPLTCAPLMLCQLGCFLVF